MANYAASPLSERDAAFIKACKAMSAMLGSELKLESSSRRNARHALVLHLHVVSYFDFYSMSYQYIALSALYYIFCKIYIYIYICNFRGFVFRA